MARNAPSRRSPGQRPAVMADVARLAGVSHQTVSRVLNHHPSVSPGTRVRVMAAIQELGYRPNSAARALATKRTKVIGVVGFDTSLHGPANTLSGVERAARDAGYFVSVAGVRTTRATSSAWPVSEPRTARPWSRHCNDSSARLWKASW